MSTPQAGAPATASRPCPAAWAANWAWKSGAVSEATLRGGLYTNEPRSVLVPAVTESVSEPHPASPTTLTAIPKEQRPVTRRSIVPPSSSNSRHEGVILARYEPGGDARSFSATAPRPLSEAPGDPINCAGLAGCGPPPGCGPRRGL